MALTCPQCGVDLQEVKAAATTGYLIVLDQCPRCGGIWSDRWEVFPLSSTAVERLDGVDTAALHALQAPTIAPPVVLECPRCRAPLHEFKDPTLPPDARIERCPNCDGMWFNRGELRRFKNRNGPHLPLINEAELDRLAQAATGCETLPTVSHLDDALRAGEPAPEDVRGELAAGAAWLVVRTALRLLLHI
jgi:Zn-finger nucleic acid-binding protein